MHVEKRVHDEQERVRRSWGPGGDGEEDAHCLRGGECVYRGVSAPLCYEGGCYIRLCEGWVCGGCIRRKLLVPGGRTVTPLTRAGQPQWGP